MQSTSRLLLVVALIAGMLVVACADDDENGTETPEGGDGAAATAIDATMSDFEITLGQDSAPAGEITFTVENEGPSDHEFVIVATDMEPDSLPVEGGVVNEDEVEVVGRTEVFPAGETRELEEQLDAGEYVIICNVPGHYSLGMYTGFTAE